MAAWFSLFLVRFFLTIPFLNLDASEAHLSDYIRPFVGTQGEGDTYPGPSAPFGMIQLSPDTDRDLWDTASATNIQTRQSWALR
jgi:putative alpha-1,2-mannosidase